MVQPLQQTDIIKQTLYKWSLTCIEQPLRRSFCFAPRSHFITGFRGLLRLRFLAVLHLTWRCGLKADWHLKHLWGWLHSVYFLFSFSSFNVKKIWFIRQNLVHYNVKRYGHQSLLGNDCRLKNPLTMANRQWFQTVWLPRWLLFWGWPAVKLIASNRSRFAYFYAFCDKSSGLMFRRLALLVRSPDDLRLSLIEPLNPGL